MADDESVTVVGVTVSTGGCDEPVGDTPALEDGADVTTGGAAVGKLGAGVPGLPP